MRIVVLGGAGIIGRPIVHDLSKDVEDVIIADQDIKTAEEVASHLGATVSALHVDVTDHTSLDKSLKGADVCINSVNYYFNLDVMKGCLRNKVPYIDLGGLFHTTREQLKLHAEFERAGVTALLGLGSCPGIANVQAGILAAELDTIDYVKIYNGSTLDEGESLAWGYSFDTILDEISKPAMIFRDGEFMEMPPLGEEERYMFKEPIGHANTHLSLHSEVATIPISFAEKGIKECFFKITYFGYSEVALRRIQFLAQLGLTSTQPLEVNGALVSPRQLLLAVMRDNPATKVPPKNAGFKDVVTESSGIKAGNSMTLRMDTYAWPNEAMKISGGKAMIAFPPAIVARWIGSSDFSLPGVWAPEMAITGEHANKFFEELSVRGIKTEITRTTPFNMS